MENNEIKWRTFKGTSGDLQSLLIGEYNGISFSELFTDSSPFNISFKITKRKITKAIEMIHSVPKPIIIEKNYQLNEIY